MAHIGSGLAGQAITLEGNLTSQNLLISNLKRVVFEVDILLPLGNDTLNGQVVLDGKSWPELCFSPINE